MRLFAVRNAREGAAGTVPLATVFASTAADHPSLSGPPAGTA